MKLYKCYLKDDVYFVTATSYNEAEGILHKTLDCNQYGFSSQRVVYSMEMIDGVLLDDNLDLKCGLYKVESKIEEGWRYKCGEQVEVFETEKNISKLVIANTFSEACATSIFDKCNKITLIAKNKTFCGKYQFNENGIGIILEPIKKY